MNKNKKKQLQEDLQKIQEESQKQALPEQKRVFSVSEKIRKRVHNLPDPTRPPLGYDEHKAFDRVFPYIRLPRLHPPNHGDTVIFNASELPVNQLILGDNLEVLRTLPSDFIDLIYIDPPFFSGRTYNVIWGDTNEVRTFYDIWEGGIDSYLIWLNARLWEMRRVLKKTGSIYVHCDWHASHYIKTEMDKIFGYENFQNEIVWHYQTGGASKERFSRKHDIILWYTKTSEYKYYWDRIKIPRTEKALARAQNPKGARISVEDVEKNPHDVVIIQQMNPMAKERIGYPTQKPEELLKIILLASSDEGDLVADFFCGGGTTLAVAMKLKRRFIGCDSSRVATSVTLDRLVKIGEEMSGVKSNVSTGDKPIEEKLQMVGVVEKVPNIEVSYLGVYPIDKFTNLDQDSFIDFVLTCYGANHNTASGITSGFRPPGQQEPIFVGPANPNDSVDAQTVKVFFDEIKSRLEPDKLVHAKIIGWRFNRQVVGYIKVLKKYIEDNQLPMEIDLVPLDSREFRQRILRRYQDVEDAEFYLRFSKPPVIGDIRVKKVGLLEYEFEAIDAFSSNEDGYLVNCQWDFDYQEGHFAADKDYILSRQKVKPKGRDERFEAILTAKHKFEKEGEWTIACKVQDNLAGETILAKKIKVG
ncbi:MAG TPA: site-specific DNA-methyltransferase [Desulfatiglandales bacterium]|nr:site-specific DNA-methyltransferase [Desulfatiglandales bacterium]